MYLGPCQIFIIEIFDKVVNSCFPIGVIFPLFLNVLQKWYWKYTVFYFKWNKRYFSTEMYLFAGAQKTVPPKILIIFLSFFKESIFRKSFSYFGNNSSPLICLIGPDPKYFFAAPVRDLVLPPFYLEFELPAWLLIFFYFDPFHTTDRFLYFLEKSGNL